MGLRDRLSAKFYMPLVAGVDAARRGGPLSPNLYTPGLDPDNPSDGDGGVDAIRDPNITRPTITSPAQGATSVEPNAVATSSAFASTDGQTHAKSRWVIEQRSDVPGPATTMMWWDSGPTTTDLTSIDLTQANLGRDITYSIKVRHKGAPGTGWSAWSPRVTFTMTGCEETARELVSVIQDYQYTLEGTNPQVRDLTPPVSMANLLDVKCYVTEVYWDDYGSVDGNVASVVGPYDPAATASYTGPPVLIHNGYTAPTVSTSNTTGPFSVIVWTRWEGTTNPPGDPCVTLPPPAPPPEEPEPPIFVPPPDPPVDPDPEDPDGYAQVFLNPQRSYILTTSTIPSGVETILAEALTAGGVTTSSPTVTMQLMFNNGGQIEGRLDYAVTCVGATSIAPAGLRRVRVDAHGTEIVAVTVNLPTGVSATYTIVIDTGEEDTLSIPVGFTPLADTGGSTP